MNASDAVTLREYVEAVFHEYRQAHRREHEMSDRALEQAREVVNMRLGSMNEFREQIAAERSRYLQKVDIEPLLQRLHTLEKQADTMNGRIAALVAGVAVGLAALQILLKIVVP